jgi:hypothetical protein
MMYRFTIVFIAAALFPALLCARSKSEPVDRDYLAALAVADRFLTAWQTGDQETAILLLDDRLRQPAQEEKLQALFSAAGGQSAYELCRGRKLASGRYEFPIALFRIAESSPKWQHPRPATLVIVHSGAGDWLIDKLP